MAGIISQYELTFVYSNSNSSYSGSLILPVILVVVKRYFGMARSVMNSN